MKPIRTAFGGLILFYSLSLHAQLYINEVCSTNDTVYADEDGKYPDWFELYNSSNTTINLHNYSISRIEKNDSLSWVFPEISIGPYEYKTFFASEKNRKSVVDHWEIPVFAANTWPYFVGSAEPPSDWKLPSFNETQWAQAPGPIGYGYPTALTTIPPTTSLYMRKNFFVPDKNKFSVGLIIMDLDDGAVMYLNGTEIGRFNVGVKGDNPPYNMHAYNAYTAQKHITGNFNWGTFVDESLIAQALVSGWNTFAVQTHNYADGMNTLLCDANFLLGKKDTSTTFFPLPANVPLHTNFNITSTKNVILELKNPTGATVEKVQVPEMQTNHSWGRQLDGTGNFCFFNLPTPNSSNNFSTCYSGYSSLVSFSIKPGFYSTSQQVGIEHTSGGSGTIRYTTDGSEPTNLSPVYSGPITLLQTGVLRARNFSGGSLLPSKTISGTYFINESSTLPVVSLITNSEHLFDDNTGIYMLGPNADSSQIPFFGANFWMGWSRPAYVEMFEKDKSFAFSLDASIKIQGNYSKAWPQKGFTIRAKDDFNNTWIDYPIFPDKNIKKYKSFNIRNAGTDWNTCHFRDRFVQKSVQNHTDIDIMDGRPCLLFINGQYWGVYELRERQDENYIAGNHNMLPENIDLLSYDGNVITGSNQAFFDMVNYMLNNNLENSAVYDSIQRMLDIKNFVDYIATETYNVNVDWLGSYTNNIKYWRPANPPGKWRYILWDTDLSMGLLMPFSNNGPTTNLLKNTIDPLKWNPHSAMLKQLLNNGDFKKYFINRYADLINTIWHPNAYTYQADLIVLEMLPEMERHFQRWGYQSPAPGFIGSANNVNEWSQNINALKTFIHTRPDFARNHIQAQFNLTKKVSVTLKTEPDDAGEIFLNTIQPEPLPWQGIYFDGNPIQMTATAKKGYVFQYWKSKNLILFPHENPTLELNVSVNDEFTAYFKEIEYALSVYPNPSNDQFTVHFMLPEDAQVSLLLYDISGRIVQEIMTHRLVTKSGSHKVTVDAAALSLRQGIYLLHMRTPAYTQTLKLVYTGNPKP